MRQIMSQLHMTLLSPRCDTTHAYIGHAYIGHASLLTLDMPLCFAYMPLCLHAYMSHSSQLFAASCYGISHTTRDVIATQATTSHKHIRTGPLTSAHATSHLCTCRLITSNHVTSYHIITDKTPDVTATQATTSHKHKHMQRMGSPLL